MTIETNLRPLPLPQDYALARRLGLDFGDFSPEWTEYASIDHAYKAVVEDEWFSGQFGNHKVSIDDLSTVRTLEEFIDNVMANTGGRNKAMHMEALGRRMMEMTDENTSGYDDFNGHHKKIKDFVLARPEIFRVEILVA